jgi:hypothetical protein
MNRKPWIPGCKHHKIPLCPDRSHEARPGLAGRSGEREREREIE